MTSFVFPRPFHLMECGCIAVISKKKSCNMQPGPITHKRPLVKFYGEQWKASRLSYNLNRVSIPRTPISSCEFVLHTCDNEWCINPDHLYLGTISDNSKDTFARNKNIHNRMRQSSAIAWSKPERRVRQSLALMGNSNAKGKTWKKAAR